MCKTLACSNSNLMPLKILGTCNQTQNRNFDLWLCDHQVQTLDISTHHVLQPGPLWKYQDYLRFDFIMLLQQGTD